MKEKEKSLQAERFDKVLISTEITLEAFFSKRIQLH